MPYSVITMTFEPGTMPKALPKLEAALTGKGGNGRFLACWNAEIGALNQVMIIHSYDDADALVEDRALLVRDGDPFGAGEFYKEIAAATYLPFDFLPAVQPGAFGPVYEVRIYGMRPSGLVPTIELWRAAVPERVKMTRLLGAFYAVDGALPRFMHIWPYASIAERFETRAKAIEMGVWPPKEGPAHLTSLSSAIYLPTSFSPLA